MTPIRPVAKKRLAPKCCLQIDWHQRLFGAKMMGFQNVTARK